MLSSMFCKLMLYISLLLFLSVGLNSSPTNNGKRRTKISHAVPRININNAVLHSKSDEEFEQTRGDDENLRSKLDFEVVRTKRDDDDDDDVDDDQEMSERVKEMLKDDPDYPYNMTCNRDGCYGRRVKGVRKRYQGMLVGPAKMEEMTKTDKTEFYDEECCPTERFFSTNATLVNRNNTRRQLVKIGRMVQLYKTIKCESSSDRCKSCIPQQTTHYLLVWAPELIGKKFPPIRFDEFEIDTFCLCTEYI